MFSIHAEEKPSSPVMLLKHSCYLPQMGQWYFWYGKDLTLCSLKDGFASLWGVPCQVAVCASILWILLTDICPLLEDFCCRAHQWYPELTGVCSSRHQQHHTSLSSHKGPTGWQQQFPALAVARGCSVTDKFLFPFGSDWAFLFCWLVHWCGGCFV